MSPKYPFSACEHPRPFQRRRTLPFRLGSLLLLIGILFPLILASCKSEQPADPVTIVQEAYTHFNEQDVDGFMKYISNDAVIVEGSHRYDGSEAIREYLTMDLMPKQLRIEVIDPISKGNDVTYTVKVYQGDILINTISDVLDVVVDGKIIFEGTEKERYFECITDASQAFCPEN
jgi:hypothetical protein